MTREQGSREKLGRLRKSWLISGVIGAFFGAITALFAVGLVATRTEEPSPVAAAEPTSSAVHYSELVAIEQAGRRLLARDILSEHARNPNRLGQQHTRGRYRVSGQIESVPEFRAALNETSGFHLPLATGEPRYGSWFTNERPSISVAVLGITQDRASRFEPTEPIAVTCPSFRVVAYNDYRGLVFNSCRLESP